MKNTGKLNATSPTNSGRQSKHTNSGRGAAHVNSRRGSTQINEANPHKNSGRGNIHVNSGRGTPHINKIPEISQENSGRQSAHVNVYKINLDKYNWICKRALQSGLFCAISESLGKKLIAEQIHHIFPRLRAPQHVYNENYLIPLTFLHHSLVENEIEKLDWKNQEVIIDGVRHKLNLDEFKKTWKQFRLEYEEKYEKDQGKTITDKENFF